MTRTHVICLIAVIGVVICLVAATNLSTAAPRAKTPVAANQMLGEPDTLDPDRDGGAIGGDVDLQDHAVFADCFAGPEIEIGPECRRFDFDGDGDVDLRDNGVFQSRFTKPLHPIAEPHQWQVRESVAASPMDENPHALVVNVAAEAALSPPGPEDLEPTIDVQITQEIIDKADELGSAEAIYEFVRNECAFQAYYGSQKGSVETLRQRAGNDYDLASLMIALLRALDIPARYAVGDVEMSPEQVTSWLAVDDARAAGSILFTHGLDGMPIVSGPDVVAVRCRRVWVEAFVPRGYGAPAWVPLDPAFTLTTVHEGIDIPEEMNLDAQAFVDDYYDPADPGVTLPRSEMVLELLKQDIADYIDANYPGLTLDDVKRVHEIVPEYLGVLPASLPYISCVYGMRSFLRFPPIVAIRSGSSYTMAAPT